MRRPIRLLITLAGCSLLATGAQAADCAGVFRYLPNDHLSIQEISGLIDATSSDGPGDTFLAFVPADWESITTRGKWWLLGVVYGGIVGEGNTVAGGTLWATGREVFGPSGGGTFQKGKDGILLTIRPETPIKGCKVGFAMKLDAYGALFAHGVKVGQAHEVR